VPLSNECTELVVVLEMGNSYEARLRDSSRPAAARAFESAPVPRTASDAIRVARVLCIYFMIYVHVNPAVAQFAPATHGIRIFDVLRFWIVDSVGRGSVALLSVVSGYLALYTLGRYDFRDFLAKRVRSLLVPLLLWNLVFLTMVVVGDKAAPGYIGRTLDETVSASRLPTLLLDAFGSPVNPPLGFLRDLFVCSLLTPLLIATLRRGLPAYAVLVASLTGLAYVSYLFLTPMILTLYAAGLLTAYRKDLPEISLRLEVAAWAAVALMGLALAWLQMDSSSGSGTPGFLIELGFATIRIPAAIAFWALAVRLSPSRLGRVFARLEPSIFVAFCSHLILLTVAWALWQKVLGGYYAPLYPVFFLLAPALAIVGAVTLSVVGNRFVPRPFSYFNGHRLVAKAGRAEGQLATIDAAIIRLRQRLIQRAEELEQEIEPYAGSRPQVDRLSSVGDIAS
jgi:hypothetical protein